jgi:uncharacterized BrkB/YihY/UPF0761 family membrane protein
VRRACATIPLVAAMRSKLADRANVRAEAAKAAGARAAERAQRLRWAPAAIAAFEREQVSGAGLLAGGLAYRLFFWLVPFGLLIAAIASFWITEDRSSLTTTAKSFGLSGVATHSALSAVQSGAHARWYLLLAGLTFMGYFGLGAVRALRVAAFVAWRIKPTRLRRPFRASATFSGLLILGLAATLLTSWLREHHPAIGVPATAGTIFVYLAIALYAFDLLPHDEGVTWRSQFPGAALAACGVTAVHVFTVYYLAIKLERSPKLYGALGAATVVLLGLFLIARVVISGMFLNATLARRATGPAPPPESSDRDDEASP